MQKLTEILLSENVCENFKTEYASSRDFRQWIDTTVPEVSACFNQRQNTPWHIYNVMEHILHSVEEMNALTADCGFETRKMLAYVMFFHDLGKPAYHTVKEVNGQKTDSFKFHNIGSEKAAVRVLPFLDFTERERTEISLLVREHDVFLKISENPHSDWQVKLTPEFIKDYVAQLDEETGDGRRVFEWLIKVGIADNRAQNPAMTKNSLALIYKIRDMFNKCC